MKGTTKYLIRCVIYGIRSEKNKDVKICRYCGFSAYSAVRKERLICLK